MDVQMDDLDFTKVVTEDLISLDLMSTTKMGVIAELTNLLFVNGCVTDEAAFIEDVLYRESAGPTGLEKGIAIPHGKSDSVQKTSIAIGRTNKEIEWESLDGGPINIIILFAVKNSDKTTTHIKLLQKVAVLLADEEKIEKFQTLQTKREFIEIFAENN
ncbi:fructose PTS transporter subunit IIA [Niallia taxi]|nr:fructose PTS transporter subunit IIA [Niallia taxi]MDE5053948.1 fructose PTS transporter subunit IIA [Niallia taxi]